ncbi:MAG: c-type cytochrome, partial [Planctomycetales bacterium]|nr:c-type cytochrome [Planctomycetales bacterium]
DGWLYGCHGVFTHSKVGAPETPDQRRVPLNAGVWRYHPQRRKFEVFAWGTSNPWGVDFDDHGQAFITACVIPHLYHVVHNGRYQRQAGRHFDPFAFDDIKTIADHAHYAGNIADHAWWGRDEAHTSESTLAAGGGHAHCGAMIYLGDNWPDAYRGRIYMHNVHGNRINCDILERKGSGFVGKHGPDLMLANDQWFRGIGLRAGPDGAAYSIDWYDPNACHRVTPEIWDRTNGRIYRIAYGETPAVEVDLTACTDLELVELMTHANEWHVRMARRVLQERGDVDVKAIERLLALAAEGQPLRQQLRALWTLHAVGAVDESFWHERLASSEEYVRAWAIQLALDRPGEESAPSQALQSRLTALAHDDQSPVVRLYLASALPALSEQSRRATAHALAQRGEDAEDHNLPLLIWYGVEPMLKNDLQWAMTFADTAKIPLLRDFTLRRLAYEREGLPKVLGALAACEKPVEQRSVLQQLVIALSSQADLTAPPEWDALSEALGASNDARVRELAIQTAVLLNDRRVLPLMRQTVADGRLPLDRRLRALSAIVRTRDQRGVEALGAALALRDMRDETLRALATFQAEEIPELILARYGEFDLAEKQSALETLASRAAFARPLLDAVIDQRIARSDLLAQHVRQLRSLDDPKLSEAIDKLWGQSRETPREKRELFERLKRELTPAVLAQADVEAGRKLFEKHCATCHTLFGQGGKIGPDLTGSNRANLEYVLENLADPSALVGRDYQSTVIITENGRSLIGLIVEENDSALTLQTATEKVVVPKSEIEERFLSEQSLMPDGLTDALPGNDLRDLAGYLASPK